MTRVAARLQRIPATRVLAGGTLTLFALRLTLSVARSGPVIMADEAGYLMHARVLAGGMPAEMGSSPFYRGGYSLLVAPVMSLGGDPVFSYHGVLVVNAVLAAFLAPLLYLLLTHYFGAGQRVAAWAAVAAAAYPSVTALSQVALSENLLFVLTPAWMLAAGALVRRASVAWAVATAVCAAALWTVHGRMLVVVLLTAVLLCAPWLARRRRAGVVVAATGLVALAGGLAGGALLNDWLLARNYDRKPFDELGYALDSLDHLAGIAAVLENVAGHAWYLLVATLGLALLVFAREVPAALARLARRRAEPADVLLALVALTTAGLLVESALWFATRDRPDQLVYGRYVEPVAPILVALGIAALVRPGGELRRRALALGLGALTLLVAVIRTGLDLPVEPSRWNVASLPAVTGRIGAPLIVLAGVVAIVAFWVLAARVRPVPPAFLVLALFAPTTAYIAYLPVLRSEHDVYPAGWTSPRAVVERLGATRVGYDLDAFDHVAVKTYQWALPHTRMVLFEGHRRRPPSSLFFSSRTPGHALVVGGGRIVWSDPGRDQVLWQVAAR